jgi:hypothetical protein
MSAGTKKQRLKWRYIWSFEQDGGIKGEDTEEISNWTTRRETADM